MAKCIDDLVRAAKGTISKKEAEEIVKRIEREFKASFPKKAPKGTEKYDTQGEKSPEQRMIEAAETAFKERLEEKQQAVRRKELQIEKAAALQYQVVKNTPVSGKDTGRANIGLRNVINVQVSGRVKAITEQYMAELYRGLEPFLNKVGFKKLTAEQEMELVRVMMSDEPPGKQVFFDPAKMSETEYLAHQYRLASDMAYNRANEAGADIKYLRGRVPQQWDSRTVRWFGLSMKEKLLLSRPGTDALRSKRLRAKASEGWIDFILPKVDREKYLDPETGQQLDDEAMREMLRSVWQTLATHGLSKEPDGLVMGRGSSLADQLGAHRELHFATPEAWLEANRSFGAKDIYQAMVGDLRRKAQSIALMETFGPNPETGFKTADAYAKSQQAQATLDGRHSSKINEQMFAELMGKTASASEDRFDMVNRFMQGTRNYITASKMGMLLLSQVNDIATFRAIAQTDGLDTGRAFRIAWKLLNPKNKADREIARKHAILAQSVINDVALRFGAEQTQSMSRKLANWTVTLTGAEHWTNAMKQGFQTLLGSHVADYKGLSFDMLQPRFRRMMERYGIEAGDWDIIRQSEAVDLAGVQVVTPYLVKKVVLRGGGMEPGKAAAAADNAARIAVQEAATKYGAMLAEEADTAMLTPDVRTQAIIHQKTEPGTLWGEFARSVMLFKTFSIAMLTRALPRIFDMGAGRNQASIAAQWALGMVIGGAISTQLKEIVRGRNPRDMADPYFWLAAAAQSGGFGIFGDFFFADANRFGGGAMNTLLGPVAGLASDIEKLTKGNIQQAAEGKDTHFAAEAMQFAKNYAPMMNLWYTRLALDHLLFFHVQEAANPGYLRRMKQRTERDNNQTFWWAPDDNLPEGPPDVAEMFKVGE